VILAPTLVQGEGAAEQVAEAIAALNAQGEADVIVVARGGGSIEELWAFNEEVVARAIAASRVPVVTGVGHETDFTIADFVADLRASTPTAAATLVVPDAATWQDALAETRDRLDALLEARLAAERQRLAVTLHALDRAGPERRIADARQRVDDAAHALDVSVGHLQALARERLQSAALRLHALSPLLTIARGFAVVQRRADGARVTSVAQVAPGQGLAIRVADGSFAAVAGPRLDGAADATTTPADALPASRVAANGRITCDDATAGPPADVSPIGQKERGR
jgi:exodeoxyribonuclease VII large subunit